MKKHTSEEPLNQTLQGFVYRNRRSKKGRGTIAVLRVTGGSDILKYAILQPSHLLTIGRDPHCDLCLLDVSVSRRHAGIRHENGQFLLEDYGSRNGTYLNGDKTKSSLLVPGDRLDIGSIPLRLEVVTREELANYQKALQRLEKSGLDPLTGLCTRAYLDDHFPEILDQHQKAGAPICVVFIDIDHFKPINDRFGHSIGDDVLKQIAELLLSVVRKVDTCVRYGGEEFVVIMEGIEEQAAARVAERFRGEVQACPWSDIDPFLAVTVSCGVAQCRAGEGIREWLNRVDEALYTAKRCGRNRVAIYSEIPSS